MPVVVDQMEMAAAAPSDAGGSSSATAPGAPSASIPDQIRDALRIQRERDLRRRSH